MMAEVQVAYLLPVLRSHGVEALLLKGPSNERWLYDRDEVRTAGDIDLLVAPAQFALAEQALKKAGFVNRYDGPAPLWAEEHADPWVSDRWGLPVDLHRHLWGFRASPQRVWKELWASREQLRLGAVAVEVPSEPGRALIVALHVAHHGSRAAKPILDLRRALGRTPIVVWQQAADLARDLDALSGFVAGLTYLPEGQELRQELGLGEVRPDMPCVQPRMWFVPPTTEGFVRFAEASGPAAKMALLGRELVPSSDFMRRRSSETRLARRGRSGLAASYVVRWFKLLRNSLAGLRAARYMRR
jgi:hypothetical protein